MVAVGGIAAITNGQPCLIAYAIVRGPADAAATDVRDPETMWWLDVYMIPNGPPLPQMYAAGDILGIPARGVTMAGAPAGAGTLAAMPPVSGEGPTGAQ